MEVVGHELLACAALWFLEGWWDILLLEEEEGGLFVRVERFGPPPIMVINCHLLLFWGGAEWWMFVRVGCGGFGYCPPCLSEISTRT